MGNGNGSGGNLHDSHGYVVIGPEGMKAFGDRYTQANLFRPGSLTFCGITDAEGGGLQLNFTYPHNEETNISRVFTYSFGIPIERVKLGIKPY